MKHKQVSVLMLALAAFALAACAGAAQPQATATLNPLYLTEAVQTVYAELTQSAPQATAEVAPTLAAPTPEQPAQVTLLSQATSTPELVAAPTQTQAPTQAPTLTPLPSATPTGGAVQATSAATQSGEDVRTALGGASFKDPFDNAEGWAFAKDDKTNMYVENGSAVLVAFNPDYYYGWSQSWPKLTDFYLEIKVVSGPACDGQDKYGLIFRSPDPARGYLAALTCDGKYRLWYYDGKQEHELIKLTASSLILTGPNQTNRLGVRVVGDKISIYINGRLAGEINDGTYSEGKYGLVVGAVKTDNFTVYVDVLEYWDLK